LYSVVATDESGVARVVVLYRSGNQWLSVDLARVEGTDRWEGVATGATDPLYVVQAVDMAAGNVGTSSKKGEFYAVTGEGPDFAVALTGPVGNNDWFTGTPSAQLIGNADPNTVQISVDGGPAVPFATFPGLPAADGIYDVVVSDSSKTVSLTAAVDSTPPAIALTPALLPSYEVGEIVTIAAACTDPNPPENSGVAVCGPTSITLDTASPGIKSFTVLAVDNAGNANPKTFAYTVRTPVTYRYAAIFPSPARVSVIKAGWILPLLFRVYGPNGNQITSTSQIVRTISAAKTCPSGMGSSDLSSSDMATSTPNGIFFYENFFNNFWWLWKSPNPIPTPSKPCYQLTVRASADTGPGMTWWVKLK
ncbi:MAG: hypothetical protein ABWZ15_09365, partial [Acidimicrobiia bacterium]